MSRIEKERQTLREWRRRHHPFKKLVLAMIRDEQSGKIILHAKEITSDDTDVVWLRRVSHGVILI